MLTKHLQPHPWASMVRKIDRFRDSKKKDKQVDRQTGGHQTNKQQIDRGKRYIDVRFL